MDLDEITAVAFLTAKDVDHLGAVLRHVYPIDNSRFFDDLLKAIDQADSLKPDQADDVT